MAADRTPALPALGPAAVLVPIVGVAGGGQTRAGAAAGRMAGGENPSDADNARQGTATSSAAGADGSTPAGDAAPADGQRPGAIASPPT